MRKKQFLNVKNSLLELEKKLKNWKIQKEKGREVKIKKMTEELFFKPIIVLSNYISEPITKSVAGFKDKIVTLFKTNRPKQIVYGRGQKLRKPRKQNIKKLFISAERAQKKIKDRIIRDIRILFET